MELEITQRQTVAEEFGGLPLVFEDSEERTAPGFDPFAVPYGSVLSFDLAFRMVEQQATGGNAGAKILAQVLLDRLAAHPELRLPIADHGTVEEHRDIFELLRLFLIPLAEQDTALYKVSVPFRMEPIFTSPALDRLLVMEDVCYQFNQRAQEVRTTHLIAMGCTILQRCYGVDVGITPSDMLNFPCPRTSLRRFFRPVTSDDYIEVVPQGELPDLSPSDIQRLLHNIEDTELWLRLLPPEKFAFHGFHFTRLVEVTEEESLSRLKHRLISRDAVLDVERVRELANLVRIHFQRPELQLGLTAVDYPTERAIDHEYRIRFNLLADTAGKITADKYRGSLYDRAFHSGEAILVEDLAALENPGKLERKLLARDIRSILVAPLLDQDKFVIGLVELGSPHPSGINAFMEIKFREIRGLFRTAVERSREYIDNRIEAIMREQYTSLHPSVEWRFTQAAFNHLQSIDRGDRQPPETISFKEVYPLYGQADIVGSSHLRNAAIYQDLFDNLRSGRFILVRALDLVDFPIVNQTLLRLDDYLTTSLNDFDNGHEIRIGDFIHSQLTPLVRQLGDQFAEIHPLSEHYFRDLDDDLGLFYRVRRDYETSVSTLNRALSEFLSERDEASQKSLPHYFEKYKTDGVEYELYAGQSLLKRQKFSPIHLRNLRLSQLVDLCEATRLVANLESRLPMPLRTAQLVFAYTSPLDIRFRMDEKRFDVDGDYNVRYEILKKRIDKATIHGGKERLTQTGMISIVYLHDRDYDEYHDYLGYLRQAGYVDGEVEEHVLDPLQSVNGLRALRFRVRV